MRVAVFHHIGPKGSFTNPIEEILAYDGLVTFDGVYTSVFDHRLALEGVQPIVFVTGDQIGREGFCNKEQLLELKKYGFTLGWHGWSHRKLTDLTGDEIRTELEHPDWIEPIYAYPHGDFDDRCLQLLESLKWEVAYSTTQGNDNRYSRHREYLQ